MATILGRPKIELNVTISLSESEARALYALVGYGDDAFIEAFHEKLGKAYMSDHVQGLRSLFVTCRLLLPAWLSKADTARKAFDG